MKPYSFEIPSSLSTHYGLLVSRMDPDIGGHTMASTYTSDGRSLCSVSSVSIFEHDAASVWMQQPLHLSICVVK